MKVVIQRVSKAKLACGEFLSEINKGLVIYFGAQEGDSEDKIYKIAKKVVNMRIFEDAEGKTNLGLADVGGELLLISQFTLYANCKKGNRPSFTEAGSPDMASALYDYIVDECRKVVPKVETGEFAADMKVALVNDGPFTVILDNSIL